MNRGAGDISQISDLGLRVLNCPPNRGRGADRREGREGGSLRSGVLIETK